MNAEARARKAEQQALLEASARRAAEQRARTAQGELARLRAEIERQKASE